MELEFLFCKDTFFSKKHSILFFFGDVFVSKQQYLLYCDFFAKKIQLCQWLWDKMLISIKANLFCIRFLLTVGFR